jgi:hypothetical protein
MARKAEIQYGWGFKMSNLVQKLDNMYYGLHRIPTSIAYHALGMSKYASSKLTTAIGAASLAAYNATLLGSVVMSEGVQSLITNAMDSPERFLTELTTVAIDIAYPIFYAKNWARANTAERREAIFEEQALDDIPQFEEVLQRKNYSPSAVWYTSTQAVWPLFAAIAGNLDKAVGVANLASIMIATSALYGARYMLSTEFGSKPSPSLDRGLEEAAR